MTARTRRRLRISLLALVLAMAPASACDGDSEQSATGTPASTPKPAGPATSAPAAALPDFAITGYWRDPAAQLPVPPNTTVYFHIQVMNQGSAPYGQFVAVRGPGNYSGGFSGLQPGETKEAVVELVVYLPPQGGTAGDIYFTVDPDNVMVEANETNNTLGPLTVVYGGGCEPRAVAAGRGAPPRPGTARGHVHAGCPMALATAAASRDTPWSGVPRDGRRPVGLTPERPPGRGADDHLHEVRPAGRRGRDVLRPVRRLPRVDGRAGDARRGSAARRAGRPAPARRMPSQSPRDLPCVATLSASRVRVEPGRPGQHHRRGAEPGPDSRPALARGARPGGGMGVG